MAITKNLLPKCVEGHETQQTKPNTWESMKHPKQFIDSIETSGGDLSDTAKFNQLVSSIPSPWARVHLTRHALIQSADKTIKDGILSKFYSFLCSEWRGLVAAFVLYPESFELTKPIELVSKDISTTQGEFDILSTYSEMLFENAPLWKYEVGNAEHPKMQLLYYHNGDQHFLVGGTSPFSILFAGMNYIMPEDEQRIYWIKDGKFQDPTDVKYKTYYKEGETKYNDKHFNNLKKLYSFLNGVLKNCSQYISKLENICKSEKTSNYETVKKVLINGISTWMDEIKEILDNDAEKSKSIPVSPKRLEGPLGELLNIKSVYYWRNNAFYTRAFDVNEKFADNHEETAVDVESLFINSDYLAIWKDCAVGVTDQYGNTNTRKEHDYRLSPVYFITAEENGETWFLAVPLSEYALNSIFKQEFSSIIEGTNNNVKIIAEKNGNKVDVYLKARIDAEGDWVNIRNRSFNVEIPNLGKKVFAWPNFSSSKWQKYYYYSEFPKDATGDVQMFPVFEDMADIDNSKDTENWDMDAFFRMIKYPKNATTNAHAYEIIRTNKPLRRIKIRKCIGNGIYDLGWLIIRQIDYKAGPNQPQGMQLMGDSYNLNSATVGFDFGSTNSCAYYCGKDTRDIHPIPFSNRRLAIIGFDNKEMNVADPDELLFISNEKSINNNGQIKSWLHEHDHTVIDPSKMEEELVGGVPVNETNITVKNMSRYDIITNAGKLHYNMKWLVDNDGKRRKKAFMKMVWIHICADLFAENMYPETLYWSFPSAMGSQDMDALNDIFKDIPSPCPDYKLKDMYSYTEAEAVCSYFLDKEISLENYNLFVGMDIGGSTSDILVLGKEASATQQAAVKPEVQAVENKPVPASVDYDELGRKELCDLVRQRGLAGKVDLDELSRGEIAEFLKANEAGAVDYDELSRKELCELVRQRGLAGKVDLDELSRGEIVEFLKANEAGAVDYDELSRKELCDLASQRGVASLAKLDDMGRAEIVELLKNSSASVATRTSNDANKITTFNNVQNEIENDCTDNRLFTQCSVRMAAGVFFDAIIGSKKFRDCIRNFHASKVTRIKVEGIEEIKTEPQNAPYYLNNIFDQLRGDNEFKKFYGYLKTDVPFVFSLPAYILGALMTYSGMLVRKAIITHNLREVKDIHFRYFGKGGRLFEWLFFTFKKDEVDAYLNACFEVGLKSSEIDKAFGRSENKPIRCTFDNCNDTHYGNSENSENKSEVAKGLVSRHKIKGVEAKIVDIYSKQENSKKDKYDARKQEVIGEVGISKNGITLNELDIVDDNFYRHEGSISMPRNFENFTEFMNKFILFIGQATNIYPTTASLNKKIENVRNVRNFIIKDTEFRKYTEAIRFGDASYRMPIFIAEALYYLEEVLLKEVFSNN